MSDCRGALPDYAPALAVRLTAKDRVAQLLSDMAWHKSTELVAVAGQRATARIAELCHEGSLIESRPIKGAAGKEYRLTSLEPGPVVEFKVCVYLNERDARLLSAHCRQFLPQAWGDIAAGLRAFEGHGAKENARLLKLQAKRDAS